VLLCLYKARNSDEKSESNTSATTLALTDLIEWTLSQSHIVIGNHDSSVELADGSTLIGYGKATWADP
jgi:hypothetical protein